MSDDTAVRPQGPASEVEAAPGDPAPDRANEVPARPKPAPVVPAWSRSPGLWAGLLAAVALAFLSGWLSARLTRDPSGPSSAAKAREAAATSRALAALESRVAKLETEGALVARISASGLAVVNLTAAAENPTGFAPALAAAERVLPASPDLAALRALATAGAPTRAGLAEAFPGVAARARAADRAAGGGERLAGLSRALDRMMGRTPEPPPGVGLEAALARAEARLASGDLAAAAETLGALPPPARSVAAPWVADARRRLEIDRRLTAVRLLALGQFAAVPAAPTPPAAGSEAIAR